MLNARLSREGVARAVVTYWDATEFPESIYVALETAVGFGEGCGGVGCGSVVNAIHDLESGQFFDMARIDELVLNIPGREALDGRTPAECAAFWREYCWQFAQAVNGTRIDWE
jgi:hypothetical protein